MDKIFMETQCELNRKYNTLFKKIGATLDTLIEIVDELTEENCKMAERIMELEKDIESLKG